MNPTDSILLQQLSVDGQTPEPPAMLPAMALALAGSFGSVERWRQAFVAMGKAQRGGSGWVLLSFQPREGTLVNQWAVDDTQALAGGVPILALDMDEQAHHLDHGAPAAGHVDAFMARVDWAKVYERYGQAVHAASDGAAADVATLDLATQVVLDVRRDAMFEQAAFVLPGAHWRDPATVHDWAGELPTDRDVLVYCVYGHEVGRVTALKLRARGVRARFLPGGIDAWAAAGKPLQARKARA